MKSTCVRLLLPPAAQKFFVGQFLAAGQREAIGASDGDVTRSVFIEERIVEKMSALGDGRTGGHERNFAEMRRAFIGFDQLL